MSGDALALRQSKTDTTAIIIDLISRGHPSLQTIAELTHNTYSDTFQCTVMNMQKRLSSKISVVKHHVVIRRNLLCGNICAHLLHEVCVCDHTHARV